jgi:hypothetical protein
MTDPFEPELGQMLLTNSPWQEKPLSAAVRNVIVAIDAVLVEYGYAKHSYVSNNGGWYLNDTFQIRAYCWCDGDAHPDGCPPNFAWRDLRVAWYKHIDRGESMNRDLSAKELVEMLNECISSIEADELCDHLMLRENNNWRSRCVRCNNERQN